MEESSGNFYAPSDYRNFSATFASSNRYFTENSPWVPLIVKSVANAQRNWAELALAKTFAKTSGTRQSVIGLFCIFFSRSLIGQLSFLLVPSMVHAKMNVHKHRTKQTYESNKFQYLKSFCLNTSFTFNGGCRPSLVYLYMISPIRS